ncbi:MAG: hypothetical protein JO266_21280 [Acidobacteria bacterium]|nr:hypothetical protein [Acidobacteriota bacterium]MBV9482341.1 hypothetical protein [Acidobacteriota bacterium]
MTKTVRIHRSKATVDDLLEAARYAAEIGDPQADNLMKMAIECMRRANGDRSMLLRNLTDQAWSAGSA